MAGLSGFSRCDEWRSKGYRPDQRAEEADTIDTVRALYENRRQGS